MTHSTEQIEVPENTHASPCIANVHSTPTINKRTRDDVGHSFENENQNEANPATLNPRENDGWQSSRRNNKKFIASRNRTFHNSNHSQSYRRTQTNNTVDEYDVLVFVENTQSFAFLREVGNWPAQLVGKEYSRKMPSIPPQLSGVIQNVAFNVDWDEFVQDLKRQYPQIVNVI
ncbi:unnamed protein product, partial [Rotaria magnacalcarata]